MAHAGKHLSRRIRVSSVDVAPKPQPWIQVHKKAAMIAGVSFCSIVIAALYVASFPYQQVFHPSDGPRWSVLKDTLGRQAAPVTAQLDQLMAAKQRMDDVIAAKEVQAKSIAILKAKIASATSTSSR